MDTARDNVYTEWDEVKQFAEDFVGRLASRDVGRTTS
jgi:menaquinone-dependent protoporphyrinogen IX oxidase